MPPLLQDPYRALWTSSRLGSKKRCCGGIAVEMHFFFWRTDWSKVWLACLVDWSRSFSWICWQLSEIQNLRWKPSFQSMLRSDCHWIGVPPWSSGEDRLSCMSLIYDISETKLMIWYASGVGVYGVSHKWLHQSCWHPSLLGHPSDTASVASHDAPPLAKGDVLRLDVALQFGMGVPLLHEHQQLWWTGLEHFQGWELGISDWKVWRSRDVTIFRQQISMPAFYWPFALQLWS